MLRQRSVQVLRPAVWRSYILGFIVFLAPSPANGELWISEFVAANVGGLVDEDGETSDWVELYNNGSEPVELAGWSVRLGVSWCWAWLTTCLICCGFLNGINFWSRG